MKSIPTSTINNANRTTDYYPMNHARRGTAVIFNHNHVAALPFNPPRIGSGNDWRSLESTLKNLHFDVSVMHDLELKDIDTKLDKVRNQDHTDHDCLLIAVLTYGEKGRLYSDDHRYDVDRILENFTATKCPTLATKPKIFIVQACEYSPEKRMKRDLTEVDSMTHLIPNHADFLIEYSTIPGSYAWSDAAQRGSWFIQFLCDELNKKGKDTNLLTLLTIAKQRVDREFQLYIRKLSNKPVDHIGVPITTYMLTRKLKFNDKK